jgi:hypothetical protein
MLLNFLIALVAITSTAAMVAIAIYPLLPNAARDLREANGEENDDDRAQ